MKTNKSIKIKLLALFLCAAMFLPVSFACGEKPAETAAATTEETITDPPTTAAPTEPPPPTEPPTTEAPTEPFVVDSSLSYWDQILSELEWYGLKGGTKVITGDDELAVMKKLSPSNAKREEMDVSGENVPFSAAYRVYTQKEIDNFWEAAYATAFTKDVKTQPDDFIVGVLWVKGKRLEESDSYDLEDPAQFYLGIKTPTDNWASEGEIEPKGVQFAQQDEWQKIIFVGRVLNEEPQLSAVSFNFYIGYGIQEFNVGGFIAYHFPSTPEHEKAVIKLVY